MSTTDNSQLPSSTPVLFDDFGQSRFTSKEEYKDALVKQQEKLFHVQQSPQKKTKTNTFSIAFGNTSPPPAQLKYLTAHITEECLWSV